MGRVNPAGPGWGPMLGRVRGQNQTRQGMAYGNRLSKVQYATLKLPFLCVEKYNLPLLTYCNIDYI